MADISEKLAKATELEKSDYTISLSEFGINWRLLDEDLSINGLMKADQSHHISKISRKAK